MDQQTAGPASDASKDMISVSQLRRLVFYDPDSGRMTWRVNRGGSARAGNEVGSIRKKDGYRQVKIDGRMYLIHRLAWLYVFGVWPSIMLDHANENKSDNRLLNLRECSRSQNGANRSAQKNNVATIKGVHAVRWGKSVRWKAQIYITLDGVKRGEYLGCFVAKDLAAAAYAKRASELYGEFART